MAAIKTAKKELRKVLKRALSGVPSESTSSQSLSIVKALLSLPEYQNARRISVYLSMPSGEVQTAAIVRDALSNGKRVFIPYFYKLKSPRPEQQASIMDMIELVSLQDYDGLEPDKWGIPTPSQDSISRRRNCFGGMGKSEDSLTQGRDEGFSDDVGKGLDLVITPGLGFDRDMGRLGRGMGFYDSFFARCREHSQVIGTTMPWTVGLALNEQLLPTDQIVPMAETDERLDALILGDGSVLRRTDV